MLAGAAGATVGTGVAGGVAGGSVGVGAWTCAGAGAGAGFFLKKLNIEGLSRICNSMKHLLRRALWSLCLCATLSFLPPSLAQSPAAGPAKAQQFKLANGFTLIVKPDKRAPTAVHMVYLRVGSMDEVDGASGVAHVLEHMLFKGTAKLKPGEFSRRVAALGGRENAFTMKDATGYFQQIPAGKLEEVMTQFLAVQGPAVLEAVVDPNEPPMPAKIKPKQAAHFAEALLKGQPGGPRIALTLFRDKIDTILR